MKFGSDIRSGTSLHLMQVFGWAVAIWLDSAPYNISMKQPLLYVSPTFMKFGRQM